MKTSYGDKFFKYKSKYSKNFVSPGPKILLHLFQLLRKGLKEKEIRKKLGINKNSVRV